MISAPWLVPPEEIADKNYDLPAKNPGSKSDISYKSPKALFKDILSKEQKIERLIKTINFF